MECPFCGNDPYEYVHNGICLEPVAVVCCELGCELYDYRKTPEKKITITVTELTDIAIKISSMAEELKAYEEKHGPIWVKEGE